MKVCKICGERKPVEQFPQNGAPGRYRPDCHPCHAAHQRERRVLDGDRLRTGQRNRYAADPERYREHARRRRVAKPDLVRAQMRAAGKRFRQRHPDKIREKTRIEMRNRHTGQTPEAVEYAEIIRRDPCAYCGCDGGTVDHIVPLVENGSKEWWNLVGACKRCNSAKRHRSLLAFLLATHLAGWRADVPHRQ